MHEVARDLERDQLARRLADAQAAYTLAMSDRIARMAERDAVVVDALRAGALTGREVAERTGLTPGRISQLKRAAETR